MEQFLVHTSTGQVLFDHRFGKLNISVLNHFILLKITDKVLSLDNGLLLVPSHNGHLVFYLSHTDPELQLLLHFNLVYSLVYTLSVDKTLQFLTDLKTLFMRLLFSEDSVYTLALFSPVEFMADPETTARLAKFQQFFAIKANEFTDSFTSPDDAGGAVPSPRPSTPAAPSPRPSTPAMPVLSGQNTPSGKHKKKRNWNEPETEFVDLSDKPTDGTRQADVAKLVGDTSDYGSMNTDGTFVVKLLADEMQTLLTQPGHGVDEDSAAPTGFMKSLLQKYVVGGKTITEDDIRLVTDKLRKHLIAKNIAQETASDMVLRVAKKLVGQKTKLFTLLELVFRSGLTEELTKILSPTVLVDLLHDIQRHLKLNTGKPYVLAVVGVNGVGKSTNLSKIAYWLLQNNYRVLITACDTFRLGAVQQLKVHVDNLNLATQGREPAGAAQRVELFERGYGDALLVTKVAKQSIQYASEHQFDIVLMDTAGRAHTNDQLMALLLAFGNAANPNKIIMVGEALTGNDLVAQARNFNKAFGSKRHIDFFLVSKCDTVDKSVGTIVNLVMSTGAPVLFVGVGQTYTDLRTLSVDWAVSLLME